MHNARPRHRATDAVCAGVTVAVKGCRRTQQALVVKGLHNGNTGSLAGVEQRRRELGEKIVRVNDIRLMLANTSKDLSIALVVPYGR
jgi:hypothetical protein